MTRKQKRIIEKRRTNRFKRKPTKMLWRVKLRQLCRG